MNGGGTGSKQATSVGDTSNAEEFEIEADVTQPDIMVSKSMVSTEQCFYGEEKMHKPHRDD